MGNFTRFTTDVENISALDNNVKNQAATLKATFDKASKDQKNAFNGLLDELEANTAADAIGAINPEDNSESTLQGVLTSFNGRVVNLQTGKEALIKDSSDKADIVDTDMIAVIDSESENATKKTTFSRIKSFLKTYFDTLYNLYILPISTLDTIGGVRPDGVTTTVNSEGKMTAIASESADYTARSSISTHSGTDVNTSSGVHGLRFYDSKLSYKSGSEWIDIGNDTLENRVTLLENTIFNDITSNAFIVLFDNTDGINLTEGSHNSTTKVIEC